MFKMCNYLKYLLLHKFYVLIECIKLKIPWQGVTHDLSKFLPDEFIPYMNFFGKSYANRDEGGYYKPENTGYKEFDEAWFKHQKRNPHHWQYWVNIKQCELDPIKIPDKFVKELVADWIGTAKVQKTRGVINWYRLNKNKIILHPETRKEIENLIGWKLPHDIIANMKDNPAEYEACISKKFWELL